MSSGARGGADPGQSPNPETRNSDLSEGASTQRYAQDSDIDDIPFDWEVRADNQGDSVLEGWRQHPRLVGAGLLIMGSLVLALFLGILPFFPNLTNPIIWVPFGAITYTALTVHFLGTKTERGRRKRDVWAMLKLDDRARPLRGTLTDDGMGGWLFTPIRGWQKAGYDDVKLTVADVDGTLAEVQGKEIEPDDEAKIAIPKAQAAVTDSEDFGRVLVATGGTIDIDENHPNATLKITIPEKASEELIRRVAFYVSTLKTVVAELKSNNQTYRRQSRQAELRARERREQIKEEFKEDVGDILENITITHAAGNNQQNGNGGTGSFEQRVQQNEQR